MPIIITAIMLVVAFIAGTLFAFNYEEPIAQYRAEDLNKDSVVDIHDFSIAVSNLSAIMDELGGEAAPCITECPGSTLEIIKEREKASYAPAYEPEVSSVPLPYEGTVITGVTVTGIVE